jgi:hypothetical protein
MDYEEEEDNTIQMTFYEAYTSSEEDWGKNEQSELNVIKVNISIPEKFSKSFILHFKDLAHMYLS